MAFEQLNINGINVPHTIIPIERDGACLFGTLSYLIYFTQLRAQELREIIVNHVATNWDYFFYMTADEYGNNYSSPNLYIANMSRSSTYGGLCELVAASQLFHYVFEVYVNGNIYCTHGNEGYPMKRLRFTGDLSNGHFDAYVPYQENDLQPSLPVLAEKKTVKRRARYTDATRKKQVKDAEKQYAKKKPEANRAAVKKYQLNRPEVHRAAMSQYQQTNPEIHRAAQARYENNHPDIRVERRLRPWSKKAHAGMAYDPNVAYDNDNIVSIGSMDDKCKYCYALKWKDETPGMCCSNGKVQLPTLEPPPEPLYSLLMGDHPDHVHFMNCIRKYNGSFQMTSFGANQILGDGFMPTFKVQGQVYHLIGSLLPEPQHKAQFLQIYFVGEDEREARLRCTNYPDVKPGLIKQLQQMLHNVNIYIKDLKTTIEKVPPGCEKFNVVIHAERKPVDAHAGRFNAPSANEIALVMVDQQFEKRDIVLQSNDNELRRISEIHRSYDPLQYPLMFCHGEDGYSPLNQPYRDCDTNLPLQKGKITALNFYSFRIMVRLNQVNFLLFYRSLFSQFLVDMFAKIETERLNFIRYNQKKLRVDDYIHLKDAVGRQDVNVEQLGKMVVLPSSFTGGPRYMHERTQDAMTYVRHKGRPDLFVTFTCNPKWNDIAEALLPGQKPQDRHDIIARVFHLKVKKMMYLLVKGSLFGKVQCYMYSVEWQKRGLPHVHILLWLEQRISPNIIDKVICAEIPDLESDPLLHDIVTTSMIHGPCGRLNSNSPCMKDSNCSKRYPRSLIAETQTGDDGYPQYRRRSPADGGFTVKINGVKLDNRWVVPYNPVLLRTFGAHINVESCNSVKAIKYICKYVNKGSDQASFALKNNDNIDEIRAYECGRYISSSEAAWRILAFPIHERYPTVVHLAIHLENGQRVYFNADNLAGRLENPPMTTLLAFFQICETDDFAKTLLYCEVPSYFVWNNNNFQRRKRGENIDGWPGVKKDSALGRVYTVHPNNAECYYLRLLLHEVRGPTSFSDLKTANGVLHPTFQAACRERGLLENDKHWESTLEEATLCDSPFKLRELFTVMLVLCHLSDPNSLWEKFKDSLSEDIMHQLDKDMQQGAQQIMNEVYNRCLIIIEDAVLALGGRVLQQYGLPQPSRTEEVLNNRDYLREKNYDLDAMAQFVIQNEISLTDEQLAVYRQVINSVESQAGQLFFLDAPGGTGKTFLINLVLAKVRCNYGIALAAASSGIAATLLEGGRTAHAAFKLPLNLNHVETPLCNISKQCNMAKVLRECQLIVWDESTMAHKGGFEALNRSLQDIRSSNKLMGGITVLLAGDFRQTLPVVPRGTRADEVKACIKYSHLWPYFTKLSLKTNMRVHLKGDVSAGQFSELLLRIGDGQYPENEGKISIPKGLGTVVPTLTELLEHIYPDVVHIQEKPMDWLRERAILTPKNDVATEINNVLLQSFEAEKMEYKSVDTVLQMDEAVNYPVEFLNTLDPPGFPAHKLLLKIEAPVMLLRNINPPKLCNGTRLRVKVLHRNVIEAIIFTGCAQGESVFIPRIPLITSDYPFEFKRLQFPLKVCFAMTINKAQGQSLKKAGVDLRESCFSHGQFYVACSRVSSPNSLVILTAQGKTTNVVYKEVLK